MNRLKQFSWVAVLFAVAFPVFAQNPSSFAGLTNVYDFAYGVNPQVAPLRVDIGNSATGAGTVTLAFGFIATSDGRKVMPLATNAKITIGIGANLETVTPTAISCSTPAIYDTCSVTATFANIHGTGDLVASGSFGLGEAVNYNHTLGGLVIVDGRWVSVGGVNGTITGQTGWANVSILDNRGTATAAAFSYKSTGTSSPAAYTVSAISWY